MFKFYPQLYKHYIGIIVLIVCVLIVLITSFAIVGSPVSQKAVNLDKTRIEHFSNLRRKIEDYFSMNKTLPDKLVQLSGESVTEDPETKKEYEYKKISQYEYQLCTTFSTVKLKDKAVENDTYGLVSSLNSDQEHKKGYDCFEYSIPDYYRSATTSGFGQSLYPSATPVPVQIFEDSIARSNATSNNTKRLSDVGAILNAITQFKSDKSGDVTELGITPQSGYISSPQFKNMCKLLVPTYIAALPLDPAIEGYDPIEASDCEGETWNIYYTVKENPDKTITVSAPLAELGAIVSQTR